MPNPGDDLSDANHWLGYARANLLHAEAGQAAGVVVEYLCFDAQQAAEKALKAVLIFQGAEVPRTHDIGALLTSLGRLGLDLPAPVRDAASLTVFAVQSRYPSRGEPLQESDLTSALFQPRSVLDWAVRIIEESASRE